MMPKLPDKNSFGARPAPQSRRGIASVDTGDIGNAFAGVGASFRRVADEREQGKGQLEVAKAQSAFLKTKLAIKNDVTADADGYEGWAKRFDTDTRTSAQEIAESITDPHQRAKFLAAVDGNIAQATDSILGQAETKRKDRSVAELNELIESNLDTLMETEDEESANGLRFASRDAINASVAQGYITEVEAQRLKRNVIKNEVTRKLDMMSDAQKVAALGGNPDRFSPEVSAAIAAAASSPEDEAILRRFAVLESGGDSNARNPSGAAGLMQVMPATAAQYGLADPMDVNANAKTASELLVDNRRFLERKLGRKPTGAELYLAHQQGMGGASALLSRSDENVLDVMTDVYKGNRKLAASAITGNRGKTSMTAGEFAGLWRAKYNGASSADATAPVLDYSDALPADERAKLMAAAQKRMATEAKQAEAIYANELADYTSAISVGADIAPEIAIQYSDAMIRVNVANVDDQALLKAQRDAAILQNVSLERIAGATPEDVEAMRSEIAKLTEGEIYTDLGIEMAPTNAQIQQNFDKAVATDFQARQDDPAAYALRLGKFEYEPGGEHVQEQMAMQEALGIPSYGRRALPKDQATAMVAQINEINSAERGAVVEQMQQEWGEGWPSVLNQLKETGLSAATYHAAIVSDNPSLSQRIAALDGVEMSALKEGLPATDVTEIDLGVSEEAEAFRMVLEAGDPTGSAATLYAEMHNIMIGLALQDYRRTGDLGGSIERATDDLINNRYDVLEGNNFSAYVPTAFNSAMVQDGAEAYLSGQALQEIAPFGGDESELPEIREKRAELAAKNGTWVTNDTGDGLILMIDVGNSELPARNKNGGDIEISFEDAMGYAPRRVRGGSIRDGVPDQESR